MRTFKSTRMAAIGGALLLGASLLLAAEVKTYQVTGPVLKVTPTSITVQKGNDKWEIARDQNTKMTAEPKVGEKVTIVYHMVAEEVKSKEAKAKK